MYLLIKLAYFDSEENYNILIFFLSFSCFGFPKFESEKRFYDKQLNIELKEASFLLEDLKINKELEIKLLHGVEKSVTNDYYSNKFNALLVQYYTLTGQMEKCYSIFVKEIARKNIDSKLSYILLLSEFYDLFNAISYTDYKSPILNRIQFVNEHLKGDEKKYVESILLLKKSLSFNKKNINVSRDALQKSIGILDELSDILTKEDYLIAKTKTYNFLAITYLEHVVEGNLKENDENRINHAISVFKQSLRFNEGKSAFSTFIVYNNLAYVYNVKGDFNESLNYSFKAKELIKNADSSVSLNAKLYCNMTDSYSLKLDEGNLQKYYPICINRLEKVKRKDETLLKLINQNKININPEIKFVKPNKIGEKLLIFFAFIAIVSSLYWFNKKAKK
ncbi:flagellar export chaperone FliS [Faecalibacter macacae]|uniref:hypothetical protein n=1 Tax=Faecalibacter macacae TaxID=1859289 RepID=UPI0011C4714A|nr:hypothetical protein [Faecalibacter macacae]